MNEPVLEFTSVAVRFRGRGRGARGVRAVDGVTFRVEPGEVVGLVGPSGAGKSTIARLAVGLLSPDAGRVRVCGQDVASLPRAGRGEYVHLVFQDPYSALAPHLTVERIVAEAVRAAGHDVAPGRVVQALEDVGLVPAERYLGRRPDELSGGQRQRVALARATVRRPRLLVADEPTQMLDSTSGARLLGLMAQLRQRHGTAILLITHDLGLAGSVCDRLLVLDGGRIVESAAAAEVLTTPSSAQGQRLVGAAGRMRAALERHRDVGPGGP